MDSDNHYGEQHGGVFKKVKIELPYDPTTPLLGIYPEEITIRKEDSGSSVFIAALFTTAKTWKQPKCPSTEEWMKMWCMCTMEHYSTTKKKKIILFAATWMDLEIVILSEVSQTEKEKYHMTYLTCGI